MPKIRYQLTAEKAPELCPSNSRQPSTSFSSFSAPSVYLPWRWPLQRPPSRLLLCPKYGPENRTHLHAKLICFRAARQRAKLWRKVWKRSFCLDLRLTLMSTCKQSKQLPTQQTTSPDETLQPTMVEMDAWRYQSFSILRMQSSFCVSSCTWAAHLFFRAFATHSMTHPRRSAAASEFWSVEATKTADLSFRYVSSVQTLRRPMDTHLAVERLAGCGSSVDCARSLRTCDFAVLSRERATDSKRPPHSHDPRTLFHRRTRELSG